MKNATRPGRKLKLPGRSSSGENHLRRWPNAIPKQRVLSSADALGDYQVPRSYLSVVRWVRKMLPKLTVPLVGS